MGIRSHPIEKLIDARTLTGKEPVAGDRPHCLTSWQGQVAYHKAYTLQKQLWQEKVDGRQDDFLLLLEHPPTLTFGKSGKLKNLLVAREELEHQGVSLFFTDRGGDVTYHGPGQLVAYPILDLDRYGKDIHRYIYNLQETIIRTVGDYRVNARRDEKYVGVWVGDDKIAAIGVAVRRWVTTHGIALNVNPVMEHFKLINPCGIMHRGVTSLAQLVERDIAVMEVAKRFASHFADVFDVDMEWTS